MEPWRIALAGLTIPLFARMGQNIGESSVRNVVVPDLLAAPLVATFTLTPASGVAVAEERVHGVLFTRFGWA